MTPSPTLSADAADATIEVDAETDADVDFVALGRSVIDIEAAAVAALSDRLDASFERACRLLLGCAGRVIVTGIGKSGHIGNKLAATLASTGTAAFFVHAAEASHGDLGMLREGDVVVAISYSGASAELLALVPGIKRLGLPLISVTGAPASTLAAASDVHLDVSVAREACPLGLAPTASTTATLALGDALAIALLGARGFDESDFAKAHPGGRLGRRLLLHVGDVMVRGAAIPRVGAESSLAGALVEISQKGLGMVAITDADERLLGVFTDGDLRRTIEGGEDLRALSIEAIMTRNPRTITAGQLAVGAVGRMQEHRITSLPVVDGGGGGERLVGIVTMHALLAAGVV